MAFAEGNQFWKKRHSDGKEKLFETPEKLWDAACEYFQDIVDNPLKKQEAKVVNVGNYESEVQIVTLDVMKPFTLSGLCRYLGCDDSYFRSFKAQERKNKDDYIAVIMRIEQIIYEQKFTGAASGFFNANIIARDLGLTDNKAVAHTISEMPDWMKDE